MDKPALEFHPFGTITLNFDDVIIKLRRCRLGDLEFAKNLLEELQDTDRDQRLAWLDEVEQIRADANTVQLVDPLTEEQKEELRGRLTQLREVTDHLAEHRVRIVYEFLSQVAARMGDYPTPAKEEWPIDFFGMTVPTDFINHWQTRPLVSGTPSQNQNGAAGDSNLSTPSPVEASSPPAQP